MKKIVGIIAALALAGSVFARPDVTPVITEFAGNASLEWIANLDADTYGFANGTWTEWKIQTKSGDWGGESNASADGMWGELVLRTQGDKTYTNPGNIYDWGAITLEVSTAKLHFIDGDTYFHMSILAPSFSVGEIGYVRALKTNTNTNNWEDCKFGAVAPGGIVTTPAVAAKPGEYYLDPADGSIKQKDATPAVAAKSEFKGLEGYNGFELNFGIPMVDFVLAFGDDGQKAFDAKNYAFKFAATVKPIDGLSLYAGLAKSTEEGKDDMAMAFTAGYNYKIDDQFYVKPAMQFDMVGKAMNLGAAVLFGWGSEGQTWNHDFLTFKKGELNVAENGTRTADGVSLLFIKNLKDAAGNDPKSSELAIEFYDNKLLSGLDVGGITLGAAYRATGDDLGKGSATFAAIYNNTFDIVYLTAKASFGMDLAVDGDNNGFKYSLRVGTTQLIANTDLYAEYGAGFSKYSPADDLNKGTFKVGTKISF
ncbi:MAG: hypothetical protein J6X78_05870 [Treponema sp.]|nr:hypothetical protein [Treponema sp.]